MQSLEARAARAKKHALTGALALAAAGLTAAGATLPALASAKPGKTPSKPGKTLFVSPTGSDAGACTKTAPCKTIGAAVAKAARADTVLVKHGTYAEQVTIIKDVVLLGAGKPVIDAAGKSNGVLIKGAGARGTKVSGFVVEHATFEGILAVHTAGVSIAKNTVKNNDLGTKAAHPKGECAPVGSVPGDCGEGIHLMSVLHSSLSGNVTTGNDGGILVTDELGPTAHNLIVGNRAVNNVFDCGITIAGHNPKAFVHGKPQPSKGGVYDNIVRGNVANGNGVKGFGGGILLAAPAPGMAVYDNKVTGNTANGNGLAGVVLHAHAPGEDLNGNKIVGNHVSHDGLTPDSAVNEKGTVGILIGSVTPLTGTVISGNVISNTHFGIWTKGVRPLNSTANRYRGVAVALEQTM